jgi:hypothetical protein
MMSGKEILVDLEFRPNHVITLWCEPEDWAIMAKVIPRDTFSYYSYLDKNGKIWFFLDSFVKIIEALQKTELPIYIRDPPWGPGEMHSLSDALKVLRHVDVRIYSTRWLLTGE